MRPEVSTVLLAAGLSRRMGARNKLLLPVNGAPIISHMVSVYSEVSDGEVLVVTGHDAAEVEAALRYSRARCVRNADYQAGQSTSVACGLRHVEDSELLLIGLGDQPLICARDLRALIAAHKAANPDKISIPRRDSTRGNPIVAPASLRARLLDDPKQPGCKHFTRAHSEHVQFLETPAQGFFSDIDTPEDYAALGEQALQAAS